MLSNIPDRSFSLCCSLDGVGKHELFVWDLCCCDHAERTLLFSRRWHIQFRMSKNKKNIICWCFEKNLCLYLNLWIWGLGFVFVVPMGIHEIIGTLKHLMRCKRILLSIWAASASLENGKHPWGPHKSSIDGWETGEGGQLLIEVRKFCVMGGTRRLNWFKLVLRAATPEVMMLGLAVWNAPRDREGVWRDPTDPSRSCHPLWKAGFDISRCQHCCSFSPSKSKSCPAFIREVWV